MSGPLKGLKILELTSVVLGPWAAQILADMGAEVIKIEAPFGDSNGNGGPDGVCMGMEPSPRRAAGHPKRGAGLLRAIWR